MPDKQHLRKDMRKQRKDHVASLPHSTRALLFMRPPATIAALAPPGSCIGLYHAQPGEAPTLAYARWFHENGHNLALPSFASREAAMIFRAWTNPWDDAELEAGPFGIPQPEAIACEVVPDLLFVPLLAFTATAERMGQGGGHYDRWLAAHPGAKAIGLAWDCQLVAELPAETHDRPLLAVVTPTRLYGNTL